jgi:hypothetical protein
VKVVGVIGRKRVDSVLGDSTEDDGNPDVTLLG